MQNEIFSSMIILKPSLDIIGLGLTSETPLTDMVSEDESSLFLLLTGWREASDEPRNVYILLIKNKQ